MNRLLTSWPVEIETLSPLHIGSGAELMLDYDLVSRQGRLFRVKEEALLMRVYDRARDPDELQRLLLGLPAAALLQPDDFADPSLFRYTMAGDAHKIEGRVSEQIKDIEDRPYLPGSTLKGALRTLIFRRYFQWSNTRPLLSDLGGQPRHRGQRYDPRYAASPLEDAVFGPTANYDLLRALQVRDSDPLRVGSLQLTRAQVYPGGAPIALEAIPAGAVLRATIALDEYLLDDRRSEKLGWYERRDALRDLVALGREHARERLRAELAFFTGREDAAALCDRYRTLLGQWETDDTQESFLCQIGWGAGWESKTLGGALLGQDAAAFEQFWANYHVTKEDDRRIGDPFPKSRTVALDAQDRPWAPLGWVRVRLYGFAAYAASHASERPQPVAAARPSATPPETPPTQPAPEEAETQIEAKATPSQVETTPPKVEITPPKSQKPAAARRPEDPRPGMILQGAVRRFTSRGALVDLGGGVEGLLPKASKLMVGQKVRVIVLRGDEGRIVLRLVE